MSPHHEHRRPIPKRQEAVREHALRRLCRAPLVALASRPAAPLRERTFLRFAPGFALAPALALAPGLAVVTGAAFSLTAPVYAAVARASGEQDLVRLEGKVTSVSGNAVYVDLGRDDHVEANDRVVLYPPGVTSVEGTLRSVARSSARLELDPGSPTVAVGVRVEVLVPRERVAPKPAEPAPPEKPPETPPADAGVASPPKPQRPDAAQVPPKPPPVHPPWSHPPESWNAQHPLLAPAFGQRPEERDSEVHGRAWLDLHHTTDDVGGTKRYLYGRLGTDVRVTNPFGSGGELTFDAEVQQRDFSFPDAEDQTDTDFVLRRFSYAVGGTRDEPTRFEAGRFLAREFPALGVVDGVEWTRRTEGGSRFGVNAGGLPEPFPDAMNSFHDVGVALFGRYVRGEKEELRLGAAVQNTWHDGEQDRSLVLAEAEWRPSKTFSWRNLAWIDYYDSNDVLKSAGFELTEITSQARWRFRDDWTVSATASHRRYPELLRDDFSSLSPTLIQDGELDRGSIALAHEITKTTRVDGRVDAWRDQDDSGTTADLGIAWRDLLYDRGTVTLSVFRVDGSFSSGEGVRASASRSWDAAFGMLSYEFTNFDQKDFTGEQSTLAHHAVYGTLDLPIDDRWNLSLQAEERFGDEQSAWGLGLMLQMRF
ncbi:MAG: hypothetical protein IPJ77_06290 [Planctomycetes bacterium]|nr:hypothetical protein [Planctomycetota bacterium]